MSRTTYELEMKEHDGVRLWRRVTIWGLLYAKEMTSKGKDGLTSVLRNLTKDSAWTDAEGDVSRTRASSSKG